MYENKPTKAYIREGAHYFYWDWDLYRPFDYEPVLVHSTKKSKVVLSRFHWHVATIWTEIVEEEGKPSAAFVKGIHTPILKSKTKEDRYMEIELGIPLLERIEITLLYLPLFRKLLKETTFKNRYTYEELIQDDGFPEKYYFRMSDLKFAIVIGRYPEPEEVPTELKNRIWGPLEQA